jgi:hypothetical protein
MSIKFNPKIVAAIVLTVNTVITLLIILLPSSFSFFSNINSLTIVLSYLFIASTLCLVAQYFAQKKGDNAYFLWLLSLIELFFIVFRLLSSSLNFWLFLYSLIILYLFYLFYNSFKQNTVKYFPYILYSCLFLLPILLYMFCLIFIYFFLMG